MSVENLDERTRFERRGSLPYMPMNQDKAVTLAQHTQTQNMYDPGQNVSELVRGMRIM